MSGCASKMLPRQYSYNNNSSADQYNFVLQMLSILHMIDPTVPAIIDPALSRKKVHQVDIAEAVADPDSAAPCSTQAYSPARISQMSIESSVPFRVANSMCPCFESVHTGTQALPEPSAQVKYPRDAPDDVGNNDASPDNPMPLSGGGDEWLPLLSLRVRVILH